MKRIYKYLVVAAVALTTSCMDSVNFDPNDRYTTDLAFESKQNVELYLNSFYPILQNYGQFGSNALGSDGTMSDGLTDILKYGSITPGAGTANLITTQDSYVSVSNNYFDVWTSGYTWQRRIAEFLSGLEKNRAKFGADADRFEAEARFFRAYLSFLIMRNHASPDENGGEGYGMIIRKTLDDFSVKNKERARSNIKESWDFIEEDLSYCLAANRLPEDKFNGRITVYAAQALKARAMLYAGRYSAAKEAALAIKNANGKFGYVASYADIFKNISNTEVIYGVEYKKDVLTHSFDAKYVPAGDVTSKGGYAGPSQEFVDMFDMADGTPFSTVANADIRFITNQNVGLRDPRLAASVLYNGAPWKGRAIECYKEKDGNFSKDMDDFPYGKVNTPGNTVTGYYMKKLLDEQNLNFVTDGSYQPWPEFRYAEAMLILAECYARENSWSESMNVLKELRQARFHRSDVKMATFGDINTALSAILKERCVELGFEGHRFWDLRRTRKAVEVLDGKRFNGVLWTEQADGTFTPQLHTIEMGSRLFPSKFYYFPIPESEVRNNTLAKQNSNW